MGQVSDINQNFLWVTLKDENELAEGSKIDVLEIESVVSYDLQLDLLQDIKNGKIPRDTAPVNFFLSSKILTNLPDKNQRELLKDRNAIDDNVALDDSQVASVENALSLKDGEFLLIIGPPGTGKTKVIKKIAYEFMKRGKRVLIASHTNMAVDNAIQGLPLNKTLRVGRPNKVSHLSKDYLLSSRAKHPEGRHFESLETEIENKTKRRRELQKISEQNPLHHELRNELAKLNRELKELEAELNDMLRKKRRELLKETPIIGSTLVASRLPPMTEVEFDVVIMDECSQASVSLALLAMTKGKKWILVGDHNQLLPIFKDVGQAKLEELSVFNHLRNKYHCRSTWLEFAYRSNTKIVEFPAKYVYEGKIRSFDKGESDKIKLNLKRKVTMPRIEVLDPEKPVVFIHVDGKEEGTGSKCNEKEKEVCWEIVRMLADSGVNSDDVGVIAPYKSQVQRLKLGIKNAEVKTVDSFQGREKDVIIFCVTATNEYSLRFASNVNRLNVALTRPRCKLIVIGNGRPITAERHKVSQENWHRDHLLLCFLTYVANEKSIYLWDKMCWSTQTLSA